jgi:hypothetical protein
MTTDEDMNLRDQLHDLVDGIAPVSASAARDRARRDIARRARNRRAAVGAAGVVALIAATVFVTVDRDTHDSQRPIGTTIPTPSAAIEPTTVAPTTTAPAPSQVTVAVPFEADPATASYSKTFPWGTGSGEVAFSVPGGEGVNDAPIAFTADSAGNIVMLDHSNTRLVRLENGSPSIVPLDMNGPAVTAAAFDQQGRVIIATLGDLAVFGPDGHAEGAWKGMTHDTHGIRSLEVDGNRVYFNNAGPYGYHGALVTRTLLLRDDGSGYVAVRDAAPEPLPIQADVEQDAITLTVSGTVTTYRLVAGQHNDIRPTRLLPDGSLVFVITSQQSENNGDLDTPLTYVVGRIDRSGHAEYSSVTTSLGYTTGGPRLVINDDGLAVMGSTTTGGTTVSYYPFP